MKTGISKIGLSALALVAALFVSAPAANAQSIDFRVGGGHGHHGGYDHRGYGHGGYDRGHHGGGFSIDIRIGDRYPRGPVYRGPVYRDDCGRCGDDYGYGYRQPASISVYVTEYVPQYDRYGRYCGDRAWSHYVTAYWRGNGYYYTDSRGYSVRVR